MELIFKTHFDAAHKLYQYAGNCANLHGHRWGVEVVVSGKVDDGSGMLVDFKRLKGLVNRRLPDHKYLNKEWPNLNPTAENLVTVLFSILSKAIAEAFFEVKLESLTLWESPDCGARCAAAE